MAEYITTDTELTSIADAIRTKGGTSDPLAFPAGFVSAINAIPTGGGLSCELLKSIVVSGGVATDQETGETVDLSSVDIGAENWNSNKIIYFQWRRANPPFDLGDYIGVDQFIVNYQIGSTATSIAASRIPGIITRVQTNGASYTAVLSNASKYGVLVTTFYKTGKMQLYGTLDGIINIYSMDYPGFGNPFQPIAPPAEGGEN